MNIFVAKLSSDTTPGNLTELFSQFGNVATTKVIMDKVTGRSKCYGFVEMENEEDALSAIEQLDNSNFMDHDIVVKKSESRPQNRRHSNHGFGRQEGQRHKQSSSFNSNNPHEGNQQHRNYQNNNFNRYD
ncbi:MAG: RNA-binding protein [Prolixibacteraceae bacterium]|jgi:RNA recognition motif-containing protein|nr:RNA-binding protein [Prolixibacteraceae bacterium]